MVEKWSSGGAVKTLQACFHWWYERSGDRLPDAVRSSGSGCSLSLPAPHAATCRRQLVQLLPLRWPLLNCLLVWSHPRMWVVPVAPVSFAAVCRRSCLSMREWVQLRVAGAAFAVLLRCAVESDWIPGRLHRAANMWVHCADRFHALLPMPRHLACSSEFADEFADAEGFGWAPTAPPPDVKKLIARKVMGPGGGGEVLA